MSLDIKKVINHLCSKVINHDSSISSINGSISNLNSSVTSINTTLSGLTDFYYPVGSYYETSDTTFNPNTTWGGTWVLETAGLVHVSGGTGYVVDGANSNNGSGEKDGGSTDAVVVSHSHSVGAVATGGMSANASHYHSALPAGYYWHSSSTAEGAETGGALSGSGHKYPQASSSAEWSRQKNSSTVSVAHTHTVPAHNTNVYGTGATNANMQPYVNVNRWHRTA